MSYTFRVIFDGVLAYVPDKPFFEKCEDGHSSACGKYECCTTEDYNRKVCYNCDQSETVEREVCWKRKDDQAINGKSGSGPARSLAVLVPDLRRPSVPKFSGGHHDSASSEHKRPRNFPRFRAPHFPLLQFRINDLQSCTTRRVDLVSRDISRQDEYGNLFLRREQIRFKMKAENAESFTYAGWAPCPPPVYSKLPRYMKEILQIPSVSNVMQDCPFNLPDWWGRTPDLSDPDQLESLWWLPDLARIVKQGEKIPRVAKEFLPSYRGPFPDGLIARVESSGGRLRTYDFNRDVDGIPVKWSFAPPNAFNSKNATWNRALANSLALEFFDVQDEVRIELKRLANEVIVEELVLAPGPGASRPVLEIVITNREPDLLFQEEGFNRSALPDIDFQPFYEMSDRRLDIEKLPVPFPHPDSFFGVVEKPCAGSGMPG